jgi:ribonuclease HII
VTARPDFSHETLLRLKGATRIAGLDEAGRGPLCGPVVAAAVVLDPERIPVGINDSKAMSRRARETLIHRLTELADVGVGMATPEEIDALNILRASHLAMMRALAVLSVPPDHMLIDGNLVPEGLPCAATAIVRGDALSLSIAAASIVAKVTRDRIMVDLAQHFPGYGWERNMGYPTREHLEALKTLGPTPQHRRTFAPVHNIL